MVWLKWRGLDANLHRVTSCSTEFVHVLTCYVSLMSENCKQVNVRIRLLIFERFLMNVFLLNIIVVAKQSGIVVGHNKRRQCTYMLFLFQCHMCAIEEFYDFTS